MGRACILVGAYYLRWSDWYGRWVYTGFRGADRFDLEAARRIAAETGGQVVPG